MQHTKRRFGKMQQKTNSFFENFFMRADRKKLSPPASGIPLPFMPLLNSLRCRVPPIPNGMLLFYYRSDKEFRGFHPH